MLPLVVCRAEAQWRSLLTGGPAGAAPCFARLRPQVGGLCAGTGAVSGQRRPHSVSVGRPMGLSMPHSKPAGELALGCSGSA